MKRYLEDRIASDLTKKMVFLTGPRQAGKTTVSQALIERMGSGQYLNYDVAEDRALIEQRQWDARAPLLVLDEIHKMPQWKSWIKGVYDGKPKAQQLLVTGSARLDTFRQTGDSLAGRYYALRLHPVSVREWCEQTGAQPEDALTHLLNRGGFPEPCLAESNEEAERWRRQYFEGLVRHDVLEFSRLQEVNALRLFAQMLRSRVGSPLSLASIARDLHISPTTLKKYLDILEALFIVFTVRPWHHNIARATLQSPKVYFYDTGLVIGDNGLRFENLVACALLKHSEFLYDTQGRETGLHYIRTKDGAEVDFVLSEGAALTELIECKLTDTTPHRALVRFAQEHPQARATQVVRDLRQPRQVEYIEVTDAARWLAGLAA
jgi:predicted AAA+ superfamily ATPase